MENLPVFRAKLLRALTSIFCAALGGLFAVLIYSEAGEGGDLEQELIRRAAGGDTEAFAWLVETYSAFLLAVILPVVHEPSVAEDILQETFLQVYLSLSGYVGGSFKHWLARIATHKAIDWHRQNRRRPPETLVENWEEVNGLMADPDPPVEEEVIRREALNRLRSLCRQLPEDYQRTLNGFYLEGKSYKELAVAEGITVKTVQSRLYRARNMLRAQWEEGKYGPL